jgi:hypothetical protein
MQNNIRELLGSKRFWSAVSGVGGMVIVSIVPTLADQAEQLNTILFTLTMALVTGFTVTDVVEAKSVK